MPAIGGSFQANPTQPQTEGIPPPLSRPLTIGGSRLSLLARQLTTNPDGSPNLPSPPDLSANDLPGANMGQQVPLPDHQRHQQAGAMMFQSAVPRGQFVTTKPPSSGRFLKLAIAALFLIGSVGAVGWIMRKDIVNALGYQSRAPQLPETVSTLPVTQVPGVDPAPKMEAPPQEPEPEAVTHAPTPPFSPTQSPTLTPPPSPIPPVIERTPPRAMPADPAVVAQKPEIPPRATPVEEDPPEPPKPKRAITEGVQTTRTPVIPESTPPGSLVEIGRSKSDPKVLPNPKSDPGIGNGARPVAKNVPPKCQPALNGLKSFLAAPTWRDRLKFMQMSEQMQRKAEIYYSTNADGPVDVDEIQYLRHDEDPQVGRGMHVVFVLFSRVWDYGFPVMVEQTGDEARVDWLTFVEFKDDLLNKFLANYMDGPVRFHVGIRRTHYFEDDVPNHDDMDAFEVTTPMENAHGFGLHPKDHSPRPQHELHAVLGQGSLVGHRRTPVAQTRQRQVDRNHRPTPIELV